MHEPIMVATADKQQYLDLCAMLEEQNYKTTPVYLVTSLERNIQTSGCHVVILDLDSLPVDNRLFRNLKAKYPEIHIIGLSSRPFHPELKEAIGTHIYAILSKPIDDDELLYCLRSTCENDADSRDSPEAQK